MIACADADRAEALQAACHTRYFRPYTNPDVVGCELGGAVKNVIALAVGIAEGLGFGDNTRASLITRGLAETARLGHGAGRGADDVRRAGRARRPGRHLQLAAVAQPDLRREARPGMTVEEVQESTRQTAEGVKSCRSVLDLARAHGVDVPITEAVVRVCHEGESPGEDGEGDHVPRGEAGVSRRVTVRLGRRHPVGPRRGGRRRPGRAAAALAGVRRALPPRRPAAARRRRRRLRPHRAPDAARVRGGGRRARRRPVPVLRHRHGRDQRRRAGLRRARATGWCCRRTATTRPGCWPRDELGPLRRAGRLRGHAGDRGGRGRAAAWTAPGWCCSRRRATRCSTSATSRRSPRAAQAAGAVVAVDNTTATPLGQRPLDLGADLTVGSDTKALTGHSDLLLGHVSTDRRRRCTPGCRAGATTPAARRGPFEAWLGHRSMSTLDLRLARQAANAAAVAEVLAGSPAVTGVRWPWRAGDPSFALAARQMLRPNGVVSAELADEAAVARAAWRATRLWTAATSFGGVHSTVDRRAQWGGDAVPPGFVRFSCGIEDTADLVADLSGGLAALG